MGPKDSLGARPLLGPYALFALGTDQPLCRRGMRAEEVSGGVDLKVVAARVMAPAAGLTMRSNTVTAIAPTRPTATTRPTSPVLPPGLSILGCLGGRKQVPRPRRRLAAQSCPLRSSYALSIAGNGEAKTARRPRDQGIPCCPWRLVIPDRDDSCAPRLSRQPLHPSWLSSSPRGG